MLNNSKHVFVVGLIINSYTYYYHTYKEVLLSGKPNVTYVIHFRNFSKRGTENFFHFFFNVDTYVDSIFKINKFFLAIFLCLGFRGLRITSLMVKFIKTPVSPVIHLSIDLPTLISIGFPITTESETSSLKSTSASGMS